MNQLYRNVLACIHTQNGATPREIAQRLDITPRDARVVMVCLAAHDHIRWVREGAPVGRYDTRAVASEVDDERAMACAVAARVSGVTAWERAAE